MLINNAKVFILCIFLIAMNDAQSVQSCGIIDKNISWLDVSKSRYIVSGNVSNLKTNSGFTNISLTDVQFLKGNLNFTELEVETTLIISDVKLGDEYLLLLDYERSTKLFYLSSPNYKLKICNNTKAYLLELINKEHQILHQWGGQFDYRNLNLNRSELELNINKLLSKDNYNAGIEYLVNLDVVNWNYIISNMYDIRRTHSSIEIAINKNGRNENCIASNLFEVFDCLLYKKYLYKPYPPVNSISSLESLWETQKGWLIAQHYEFNKETANKDN